MFTNICKPILQVCFKTIVSKDSKMPENIGKMLQVCIYMYVNNLEIFAIANICNFW
jgi:hypothetical protein